MSLLVDAKNVRLTYPRPQMGLRSLLKKREPMVPALDDVTFQLHTGDRLALVGLNGSGKSTLLRTIAGIYEPETGSIDVAGKIVALFNLGVGMRLDMSGRANVMLLGMVAGCSQLEMQDLMPGILAFSGLEDVIDDPLHTYSQGMAMRLIFATATELNPEILLLDEWIGAGDRLFREKAEKRLEAIVSDSHGFILASHNTIIIQRYCTKGLWLDDGKIAAAGDIDEVLEIFVRETSRRAKEDEARLRA